MIKLIIWRLLFFFNYIFNLVKKKNGSKILIFIPKINFLYFFRVNFLWDLATLKFLNKNGIEFDIKFGINNIGKYRDKLIIYNPGYGLNPFKEIYENRYYTILSDTFERYGNQIFPSSLQIKFWENKAFMYDEFSKNGIPHPKTFIFYSQIDLNNWLNTIDDKSKYIYKPQHSKSSIGIKLLSDIINLDQLFIIEQVVIIQQLHEINRDCRVIIVYNELQLQYWRNINNKLNNKFNTTSTSNGSYVQFNDCPAEILNFAINSTKKLNLDIAAWDIIETDTGLLALEVSPIYYPNPYDNYKINTPYKDYKKGFNYETYLLNEFIKHTNTRLKNILNEK